MRLGTLDRNALRLIVLVQRLGDFAGLGVLLAFLDLVKVGICRYLLVWFGWDHSSLAGREGCRPGAGPREDDAP